MKEVDPVVWTIILSERAVMVGMIVLANWIFATAALIRSNISLRRRLKARVLHR